MTQVAKTGSALGSNEGQARHIPDGRQQHSALHLAPFGWLGGGWGGYATPFYLEAPDKAKSQPSVLTHLGLALPEGLEPSPGPVQLPIKVWS